MTKNLMFIEDEYARYARITVVDEDAGAMGEITTTHLIPGRYVRIDDGRQYPQLCEGAARTGNTLEYGSNEQLAKDCTAKLYKTREGYEKAKARLDWFEPSYDFEP